MLWKQFTKAELERQYSPSSCVDNLEELLADYTLKSRAVEARVDVLKNIAYGQHQDESLDYFPARSENPPLHIFIHGGYWQALSKNDSNFAAADFVSHGISFASLNYTLAPAADIGLMIEQCRHALKWLYYNSEPLGFDKNRIFISGSSAGAHLAAMLLLTEWRDYGLPPDVIKGATLMSGIYDLRPICETYINDPLKLNNVTATKLSPLLLLKSYQPPAIIAWGENETDEFKRQSNEFFSGYIAEGNQANALEVLGTNHFDIVHHLANHKTELGHLVLKQILGK